MHHSVKVRRTASSTRRSLFNSPLLIALTAAALSSVAGCGDDDDDVETEETGGTAGSSTGGKGGTSGQGGSAGKGGTSGKGGTAGTDGGMGGEGGIGGTTGTGGKATIIDPDDFDGQEVFRFDTFGNEQFWTDTLRMNEAIQAALDPTTALMLGLKVDSEALPEGILDDADLADPATTVALISLDAVIGVKGEVDDEGNLVRVGITCALCHSTVDDSVMPGIGVRLDGHANRDLDPGAIIALAPALQGMDDVLEVYNSWGPGRYDPRFNQDMINHPVLIPPIYGLRGVPYETYTGDGPISYWNAYVGITQMGGIGNFFDPRINVAVAYDEDLITPKLPALYTYQLTLEAPAASEDDYEVDAAARGKTLFENAARCNTCHTGTVFSDAGETLHDASETGMEPVTAERSATGKYRTTPLRGLLDHPPYFHDGSAATLADVVTHYNTALSLGLTTDQRADLVEYLKAL